MAKIRYEFLRERECIYCKSPYKPTGPSQKMCDVCRWHNENLNRDVEYLEARYKVFGDYKERGKGSSNKRGKDNPQYSNGLGYFNSYLRNLVKQKFRYCQDCGRDLDKVNRYLWCVHHIDHNHNNNVEDNLTLLCKSCHQIRHQVWKNFAKVERATTISEESTPKWVEAADSSDTTDDIV